MPARETYMLHLYRSRAVSGLQWAARLDHLPGGESVRFRDPQALLAHLAAVVGLEEHIVVGLEEHAPLWPDAPADKGSPATQPDDNV